MEHDREDSFFLASFTLYPKRLHHVHLVQHLEGKKEGGGIDITSTVIFSPVQIYINERYLLGIRS